MKSFNVVVTVSTTICVDANTPESTQHHLVSSAQQLLAESPWHCRS